MATVVLRAPASLGVGSIYAGPAFQYVVAADLSVTVDASKVPDLLKAGFTFFFAENGFTYVPAPIAAELVSIVAAVLPVSGTAFTIAAQPGVARKLQVRCVQSGAVASLVVNIVGTDGRGNAVSESVSVAGASSATFATANAYSHVTSATPVGTVTNVTTLGIGVGPALALVGPPVMLDLVVYKETATATDETVGTVDTVACTVSPTTAPDGTHNFTFLYGYNRASQ
jgi:hypothetical protein